MLEFFHGFEPLRRSPSATRRTTGEKQSAQRHEETKENRELHSSLYFPLLHRFRRGFTVSWAQHSCKTECSAWGIAYNVACPIDSKVWPCLKVGELRLSLVRRMSHCQGLNPGPHCSRDRLGQTVCPPPSRRPLFPPPRIRVAWSCLGLLSHNTNDTPFVVAQGPLLPSVRLSKKGRSL